MKKNIVKVMVLLTLSACSYDQPAYDPVRKVDLFGEDPVTEVDWKIDGSEYTILQGNDVNYDEYELVWADEFEGDNASLDNDWTSQNSTPVGNSYILCSRWRENTVKGDGVVRLYNKKESRNTEGIPEEDKKEWTSGNIWTKKSYQYGYFECRYKYAASFCTNNSFWLMPAGTTGIWNEMDCNEGHFPNKVNTNVHNHSSNPKYTNPKAFSYGVSPYYSFPLSTTIKAEKLRISSKYHNKFHLGEIRVYGYNENGYPEPSSNTADSDITGLINYASRATITSSGSYYEDQNLASAVTDGSLDNHWITQAEGEKWVELDFGGKAPIRCIQFSNGYYSGGQWQDLIYEYAIEAYCDGKWTTIRDVDLKRADHPCNFSSNYNVVGFEWTEKEMVFYLNGVEIRRIENTFCHTPCKVWLSEAILDMENGNGPIDPDVLDGSYMEVDYVRIYKKKSNDE